MSNNDEYIREQIALKNSSVPYQATSCMSKQVITDHDSFPYQRWYRGDPRSTKPIIADRQAGWRERHDRCYQFNPPKGAYTTVKGEANYPNHCWQGASNVITPCHPEYLAKYADKALLDSLLNKACIVQYR